jgi:hypothetical protein
MFRHICVIIREYTPFIAKITQWKVLKSLKIFKILICTGVAAYAACFNVNYWNNIWIISDFSAFVGNQ